MLESSFVLLFPSQGAMNFAPPFHFRTSLLCKGLMPGIVPLLVVPTFFRTFWNILTL